MNNVSASPVRSQAHGISSVGRYNYLSPDYNLTWSSNITGVTERELFLAATWDATEIFRLVFVRTFVSSIGGKHSVRVLPATHPSMFREQRHRKFGRCYSLQLDERIRQRGVYYIKME